jgi:phosphoserine aminotransferase
MPVYNFSAGPAILPKSVLKEAAQALVDWKGTGLSVLSVSHRSDLFTQVVKDLHHDYRGLLNIPDTHDVLLMHGGASAQFSAVPMNVRTDNKACTYVDNGFWSKLAIAEAQKYRDVTVVSTGIEAAKGDWVIPDNAAYVHYTMNETIDGIEMFDVPDVGDVPLVCDMSSNILSRPIDVSKFGLIYAGAQKNIGPDGVTFVIIRKDLMGKSVTNTPTLFDYQAVYEKDSMPNTPCTFAWYMAGLMFKWLKAQGGLDVMEQRNIEKSKLLYGCIDRHDCYRNDIPTEYRSRMNVPFHLPTPEQDTDFVKQAEALGLSGLKGHRATGGMRASIYNAMPLEGVQALVDWMDEFAHD